MLVSYNWLKNYIDLPEPAGETASKLLNAGVAVEQVKILGDSITGVVIAELLSVEKHPQADRLSLTKVFDGKETFQVVCGAKNIAPGQKVPLAKVGAVLPGNFQIKEAKIRGVESFGMLCSAKELGLAEDAEGIFILPPSAPLGTNFLEFMGLPDTLIELEITPNRADLLSHLGVAREAGGLYHRPIRFPQPGKIVEKAPAISKRMKVSIEAPDLCLRYTCRILEGVKIGPSPLWLSQALEKLGHKSINNVVDVTNYVLLEMGQPLHAFDLSQIQDSQILVRKAKAGEKIPLLDKTERELKPGMLVIADKNRPLALAGIMGGANSQVTDSTVSLLLESALFLPGCVRKTARAFGISTDSSYRFERGVDPEGVERALTRATALILEIAGGTAAEGILSVAGEAPKPVLIPFRPSRSNSLLGIELPAAKQLEILKGLGCEVENSSSAQWTVKPPSSRLDLTREIDLIEEVARLNGYDQIPLVAPRIPSKLSGEPTADSLEKFVRASFHQSGFYEALNSSFLPADFPKSLRLAEGHPLRQAPQLLNPIADDQKVLRPTLLPSLLVNTQLNLAHQQETVALYELNKVFFSSEGKVEEKLQAAAVLAGLSPAQWHNPERKVDFYDLKGLAENLVEQTGLEGVLWEYGAGSSPYDSARSFQVKDSKGGLLLWGGALSPKVLKEYGISASCFALEVEIEALSRATRRSQSFTALPKFPSAWRDIALVVPDGVTSAQVEALIAQEGGPELKKVHLFDLYRGPNLSPGFRSLAYRMHFQDPQKTLTDGEVSEKVSKVVEQLKKRYSIALR